MPQPELLDDVATTPIPVISTVGLAPGAASSLTNSGLKTEIEPDEVVDSVQPGSVSISNEGKGVWINADSLPGCVLCNIGESKRLFL